MYSWLLHSSFLFLCKNQILTFGLVWLLLLLLLICLFVLWASDPSLPISGMNFFWLRKAKRAGTTRIENECLLLVVGLSQVCVLCCPWALEAEHSSHYCLCFFSLYSFGLGYAVDLCAWNYEKFNSITFCPSGGWAQIWMTLQTHSC